MPIYATNKTCFDVGTKSVEPFIILDDNLVIDNYPQQINLSDITGYTVDVWISIWNTISDDTSNSYNCVNYYLYETNLNGLNAVYENNITAFVAGTTITSDREDIVDFIPHYRDTGLQIMTHNNVDELDTFVQTVKVIFSVKSAIILLILLEFIFAFSYIAFVVSQFNKNERKDYKTGIKGFFEALTWVSLASLNKEVPKPRSRGTYILLYILTIMNMLLFALALVSFNQVVSNTKSSLTITDFSDLKGHDIGIVRNTVPYEYISKHSVSSTIIGADSIDDMFDLLIDKDVDAIVYDSPILIYEKITNNELDNKIIVGDLFDTFDLGIAVNDDDAITHDLIKDAMIDLRRSGEISDLEEDWFESDSNTISNEESITSMLILLGVISGIVFGLAFLLHIFQIYRNLKDIKNVENETMKNKTDNNDTRGSLRRSESINNNISMKELMGGLWSTEEYKKRTKRYQERLDEIEEARGNIKYMKEDDITYHNSKILLEIQSRIAKQDSVINIIRGMIESNINRTNTNTHSNETHTNTHSNNHSNEHDVTHNISHDLPKPDIKRRTPPKQPKHHAKPSALEIYCNEMNPKST